MNTKFQGGHIKMLLDHTAKIFISGSIYTGLQLSSMKIFFTTLIKADVTSVFKHK